jgi:hypothetical protein
VTHISRFALFAAFANVVVPLIVFVALRLLDRDEFGLQTAIVPIQIISISKMLKIEPFSHRSLAK